MTGKLSALIANGHTLGTAGMSPSSDVLLCRAA